VRESIVRPPVAALEGVGLINSFARIGSVNSAMWSGLGPITSMVVHRDEGANRQNLSSSGKLLAATRRTVRCPIQVKVLLEALVGLLEAVVRVKEVGVITLDAARELEAVATEILRSGHCIVEQLSVHTGAAPIFDDMHRLDLGAAPTSMLKVAEREELQHAHDAATQFGDQEVRAVGAVDFAKSVNIIVDVASVVGAWAESSTE